ncbi:MAG: hypothetical protein RIQ99_1851 [Pseudomonadota bacterium]|jgi:thiosulfate reductase cytochrome b subunit
MRDRIENINHLPEAKNDGAAPHHHLATRVWHWLNVLALAVMLMSGLMIFNAHPRLYWGQYGANLDHAWLDLTRADGVTFPGWVTIPSYYSLADARLWHFAFAWLLVVVSVAYAVWSLASGHLRRKLLPHRAELAPARFWRDVLDHLRLDFSHSGGGYNTLQKLAYCGVLYGLVPLAILTGMAMSPALDAAFPVLLDLFGGRQSARSLHFIVAAGLVAFVFIHLVMLVLARGGQELQAMVLGEPHRRNEAGTGGE